MMECRKTGHMVKTASVELLVSALQYRNIKWKECITFMILDSIHKFMLFAYLGYLWVDMKSKFKKSHMAL